MSGHRLEVTGHCDCCLGHPAKPGSYWTLSQRGSKPRIRVKPQPGVTPARSVEHPPLVAEVLGEKGAHREGVDWAGSQAMRCGSVCVARPQAATCLQNHPPEHAVQAQQEDTAMGCPSRSPCPRLPSCPHLSSCDLMPGVLHQPETEPTLPQMGGCQTLMLPISGD